MSKFERFLLLVCVILVSVLFWLLISTTDISSDAVVAFIGVLVGGVITSFVQYWISVADQRNKLRTAALDRRLKAHQEAYSLWRKLLFADRKNGEVFDVVIMCQSWWDDNCLYLSANSREAFRKAFQSANDHANFLQIHSDAKLIKSTWSYVERAGNIIVKGIELPAIGELEYSRIENESTK